MNNNETIRLPWYKIYSEELEIYHDSLSENEFYFVIGEGLPALLKGDAIAPPAGMSSGVTMALNQLRKKVEKSREKYVATKEDGAKGGKKKAENARKKAAEDIEKGIYAPPKKTEFLTMCRDVLQEYGRKSELKLALSLKQESRPELFERFCEDQKDDKPARNAEEVKAYILCAAAIKWFMDNSKNGDDQCYRLFDWLYKHKLLSPDNFADAIQHMEIKHDNSVRFGIQKDEDAVITWYLTAEKFLAAYYEEDEEETSPDLPQAAPAANTTDFKGWGKH